MRVCVCVCEGVWVFVFQNALRTQKDQCVPKQIHMSCIVVIHRVLGKARRKPEDTRRKPKQNPQPTKQEGKRPKHMSGESKPTWSRFYPHQLGGLGPYWLGPYCLEAKNQARLHIHLGACCVYFLVGFRLVFARFYLSG